MTTHERAQHILGEELSTDEFLARMWPIRFRLEPNKLRRDAASFIRELEQREIISVRHTMSGTRLRAK